MASASPILVAALPSGGRTALVSNAAAAAPAGAAAVLGRLASAADRSARLPFELADFDAGDDAPIGVVSSDDLGAVGGACRAHGLALVVSVSDADGLGMAADVRPPAIHVPAAALGDTPLIAAAASGQDVWLDTAMADLGEVAEAVSAVLKAGGRPSVLHGLAAPSERAEELNLRALATLANRFDVPVGWSARTADPAVAVAAVALGASIVIVPVAPPGGFDAAALGRLSADVRRVARALGDGDKRVQASEWPERDRLHRSLVARVAIARGATLTADMLATARPGLGLKPRLLEAIVGRRAALDIPAGTLLTLGMLE
jgi:sialic acid synthase SpsE